MTSILDQIIAAKRAELERTLRYAPIERMAKLCAQQPPALPFEAALRAPGLRVIAEIKKASPSAGVIRPDFDPVAIAVAYDEAEADCLSVLTDEQHFQGSLGYLAAVRQAVDRPLLRKDFTLHPVHLYEARAAGADAVLLIMAVLEDALVAELIQLADELGMAALVEVHDLTECDRAVACGARLLGVNNRNLHTFETDLAQTERVIAHLGAERADRLIVSESGIRTAEDIRRLAGAGVDAVLIGEAFMRADDPGAALCALMEGAR